MIPLPEFLFDTDILSEVLKNRNESVGAHANTFLNRGGVFVFSIITYYEVRRGLLFKDAHGQLKRFEDYCSRGKIVPLTQGIVDLASTLWAKRRKESGGEPPDHDTLIAATALVERRILATANTPDFSWVPGLQIANWRTM